MPQRVTFVSHLGSRNGATIALLNLLKRFVNPDWESRAVLLHHGALEEEYAKLMPTEVLHHLHNRDRLKEIFNETDLLYFNSHAYHLLPIAHEKNIPVICHVHEVPLSFEQLQPDALGLLKTYPVAYVAISEFVQNMLVNMLRVPADRVHYIPTSIDPDYWKPTGEAERVRRELNIPENALVVGGSGQMIARKGIDLFLQTANRLRTMFHGKPIYFVWLGGPGEAEFVYYRLMVEEMRQLGLMDCMRFPGDFEDVRPFYELYDVFLLPSRMESLSLVCLENTLMGTPCVAMRSSGGPVEMGEHGFVELVDTPDPVKIADAVARFLLDPTLKPAYIARGQELIPKLYNLQATAPQVQQLIQTQVQRIAVSA